MSGRSPSLVVGLVAAVTLGTYVAARQAQPSDASAPTLRYLPGSTSKVVQLIGDEDKERHQPTPSQTVTRYGLEGTDLGNSFEHDGRVYFLFGDTVGSAGRALDSIGLTDARDPDAALRLDFLTAPSSAAAPLGRRGVGGRRGRGGPTGENRYLTIEPPGISMGAFEVPVAGLSLSGHLFIVVTTDHSDDRSTDRSVLTSFTPPARFQAGRTISQLPDGHFVKMSLHAEPRPIAGLPPGGPFILMWGTGRYRQSDAYLSIVPVSHFEDGKGTRYFSGLNPAGAPSWSDREADAAPIVRNGTIGDLSVTWCEPLGVWLMTYDSRPPAAQGIEFSYARTPWGPWHDPQLIFSARDADAARFIHNPRASPPDGLSGPVIGRGNSDPAAVRGGAYAPYVVERWTRLQGSNLDIHYVLSTWNPYVVVLMRTRLRVEQEPVSR